LVIRANPALDLAPKKKQPSKIKRKLMEELKKMGKQGVGIEELLKQLLDEAASNRSSMARMEESMSELKTATDGGPKQIEAMERRVEVPPPAPPAGKATVGRSPTTEKMLDPSTFDNKRSVETWNRGSGEGILGIPPRPPDKGVSHSAPTPNFRTDPVFGKYLVATDHSPPTSAYPSHKHLPKLDFPKFNGENPTIWAKKCEVNFDVFSVPESLRTRYATLNFTDRAANFDVFSVPDSLRTRYATLTSLIGLQFG
jgi:hypothetical protein